MKRSATVVQGGIGRAAVAVYCTCALYFNVVVSLVSWALIPVALGLTPTVILSDSMKPSIGAGDIVLLGDVPAEGAKRGSVITFDDPAHPGRLLTHRVVRHAADGTYTTRGDANAANDSTAVPDEAVRGMGRVVVPAVGAPAIWIREGRWLPLLLWAGGTALAAVYLRRFGRARPWEWGWSAALDAALPKVLESAPAPAPVRGSWESGQRAYRRPSWVTVGVVAALVATTAALPTILASRAAFADTAGNPGNDFTAATSFCQSVGTTTLTATADAKVDQFAPTTNYGATADLAVDPRTNRLNHSLVKFSLPAQPDRCVLTATLRVHTTTGVAGRTLQAYQAGAAWTEGAVTWNLKPATTGTAATAASRATAGFVDFSVTGIVTAMYAGTNEGFLLKDAAEGTGAGFGQALSSRTGANPPQLVLTYTATAGKPAAPSGTTATMATATRINVSWTDNANTETGFVIERSPAGTGTWTTAGTVGVNVTSFSDTGLTPATAYDYRVRASNAQGNSAASNVATATTDSPPATTPAAPTSLTAGTVGINNVNLSWTDNATSEDSFTIERSPAGANTWTTAGTVGPNVTSFNSTGLNGGTSYEHRVRAVNNAGASTWSNTVTSSTSACSTAPMQTLTATGDTAVVESSPTANFGTDAVNFGVRSQTGANARALVKFDLSSVPTGCSVATASLRINVTSATAGRTMQTWRAASTWTETSPTWASHPATAGTAVSTTPAAGWNVILVTAHTNAMLSSGNHYGFLLRDATESAATAATQAMTPRETANPPQLIITF